MATGKRIRFFRTKIGLTQKQLGEKLGFTGRTSDVRMAQYESCKFQSIGASIPELAVHLF